MCTLSDKNKECRVSAAMLHSIRLEVINHSTHARIVSVHNQA